MPIPEEASRVHGLDSRAVAGAPSFAEVGARFARHLTGEVAPNAGVPPLLCGYNAVARVRVRLGLGLGLGSGSGLVFCVRG